MILYVNGDSNSAGAELNNSFAFANDDPQYKHLGRSAHPGNIPQTFGFKLSKILNCGFHCDAESASSNTRIMRTTVDFLNTNPSDPIVLIGWATWEREEWDINGVKYQVTAGGSDTVPEEYKSQYRSWVANQTNPEMDRKADSWHWKINEFHQQLKDANIKHLFFNSYSWFKHPEAEQLTWGDNYHMPYSRPDTFYQYLVNSKHQPTEGYHHGVEAHTEWSQILLDKLRFMV